MTLDIFEGPPCVMPRISPSGCRSSLPVDGFKICLGNDLSQLWEQVALMYRITQRPENRYAMVHAT
jgi:hypothetical protein